MLIRSRCIRPTLAPTLLALLGAAWLLTLAACPDSDDTGGAKPAAGADGKERWVVTFEGELPDPAEYRALLRDNPKAAAAYVTQMRDSLMRGRTEIEGFLTSVDGRVVERWWMSNAVTVEIPASAVESLKKQQGVKAVSPDPTLE